jgi:hypothetical protein
MLKEKLKDKVDIEGIQKQMQEQGLSPEQIVLQKG